MRLSGIMASRNRQLASSSSRWSSVHSRTKLAARLVSDPFKSWPVAMSTSAGSAGNSPGETITLTLTLDGPVQGLSSGTASGLFLVSGEAVDARWSGTDGMVPAKGYLQDGDKVVCEIDRIGRLENVVRESR
jgi:hypothetical protein